MGKRPKQHGPKRAGFLRGQHLRRTGDMELPEFATFARNSRSAYYVRSPEERARPAVYVPITKECELECIGSTLLRWHCGKCGYNATHDASPGCQKENMKDKPKEAPKGAFGGRCNRSACLKPGATWWHLSNRAYYCAKCAVMLNEDPFNKRDAQELYKGPLLVEHKAEGVPT